MDLLRPFTGFLDSINHLTDRQTGWLARRISMEIARPDDLTPLAVEALGLELLAVVARQFTIAPRAVPAWLARVRDRLHDEFADAPTLDALSRLAGVHPGHLTRMFRRHYGRSIGAYMRDVRLDWTAPAARFLGRAAQCDRRGGRLLRSEPPDPRIQRPLRMHARSVPVATATPRFHRLRPHLDVPRRDDASHVTSTHSFLAQVWADVRMPRSPSNPTKVLRSGTASDPSPLSTTRNQMSRPTCVRRVV